MPVSTTTAITLCIMGFLGFIVFMRGWKKGLFYFFLCLPYFGILSQRFPQLSLLKISKDLIFILPLYLSFLYRNQIQTVWRSIPMKLNVAIAIFFGIVIAQCFNPSLSNWRIPMVGLKVWLFYIPLIYVANTALDTPERLQRICHFIIYVALVPCLIGVLQWISCRFIGYEKTMLFFFGDQASAVTQGFRSFKMGAIFFRIPATFAYSTHYFNFTLCLIAPAWIAMRLERIPTKRLFWMGAIAFFSICNLLSGSRAAILFVPALILLILLLEGRVPKLSRIVLSSALILGVVVLFSGLDIINLFNTSVALAAKYFDDTVLGHLKLAINTHRFSHGTGSNTSAARYLGLNAELQHLESYYAKAIWELSILGLLSLCSVFVIILRYGMDLIYKTSSPSVRACASALVAILFIEMINNLKGTPLDWDPLNVLFWFYAGLLMGIHKLSSQTLKRNGV